MKDLKYRVDKITGRTDLRETLPKLLRIPEFGRFYSNKAPSREWKNAIVKYIGFMYDPKSELISEYPRNLDKRKEAAAERSGFVREKSNENRWKDSYRKYMKVDQEVVPMILAFLRDHNNMIWTAIVTTEQELEEYTELRWEKIKKVKLKGGRKKKDEEDEPLQTTTDIDDKDLFEATNKKEKLMDACQKRIIYLEELYEKFFRDNADVQKAVRDIPISPENATTLLRNVS